MSYETLEAGLQAVLQGCDGFAVDRRNVVLGDYTALARGVIKAIVLHFRGMPRHERRSFEGVHLHYWAVNCELLIRYRNDSQVRDDLRDNMQAVVDRLDQYPELNGTTGCWLAEISAIAAEASSVEIGGVHFMSLIIGISMQEEVTVSEQE